MMILLKLKGYLIAFGGLIVAILGTYFLGRYKGDKATKEADQAAQVKAQSETIQRQAQTRQEVDNAVDKLPKPTVPAPLPDAQGVVQEPATPVADSQPGTAGDELRQKFMRET